MKIEWSHQDEIPEGPVKVYSALFLKYAPGSLISNVQTTFKVLRVSPEIYFPVTINDTEWKNSFVCSPYTAYALYSRDELRRKINNKLLRFIIRFLIRMVSKLLRWGAINKNVHINNFLLSTNPYPDWDGEFVDQVTSFISLQYPGHAIIFRSLNQHQHNRIICKLKQHKYRLIGSRQVYIYDQNIGDWKNHNNNRQDKRIIKNKKLVYLGHDEMEPYLEEALLLYQRLYLEKYSYYNPQFTFSYFEECHKNNIIIFQGYRDGNNQLKAFSGIFVVENTITSPLVGYDTHAPKNEALYIHAIQSIFDYKFRTGKILNLSSGAPRFKRLRGGKPSIEYSAVYTSHLNFKRRFIWNVLQLASNKVGVPLMKKYEL
ncbi:MAG: hypothetical protein ABI416_12390 [Ginsengibacter sp.]